MASAGMRASRSVRATASLAPGSSVRLAKAIVYRRSSAPAPREPASRTTTSASTRAARRRVRARAGGTAHDTATALPDAVDPDEVAGHADGPRHRHVEEERRTVRPRGLGGHQVRPDVLDDVDAVVGDEDVVDDERLLGILAGNDLDRPRVGADGDDLLVDEPLRRV